MKCGFSKFLFPKTSSESDLAGFLKRNPGSETLGSDQLGFRILWLSNDQKNLIIISIDTLYIPHSTAERIYGYLENSFSVLPEYVMFNATHTHSAPNISLDFFGTIDKSYRENLEIELERGLAKAYESLAEAQCFHCSSPIPANCVVNRRKRGRDIKTFFLKKRMLMLPNREKKVIEPINCLVFSTNKHKILAYNFPCHPVFSSSSEASADFPGEVANLINKNNSELEVIFIQGFCGDLRPDCTTRSLSLNHPLVSAKVLFNKEAFLKPQKEDFSGFCSAISNSILGATKDGTGVVVSQDNWCSVEFIAELRSQSGRTTRNVNIKIHRIDNLLFVNIPAEVNSRYFCELKAEFPQLVLISLGFADDIIGYLPFVTEIAEGGYEVNSAGNYGWDSIFDTSSVKVLYEKLVENIYKLTAS